MDVTAVERTDEVAEDIRDGYQAGRLRAGQAVNALLRHGFHRREAFAFLDVRQGISFALGRRYMIWRAGRRAQP